MSTRVVQARVVQAWYERAWCELPVVGSVIVCVGWFHRAPVVDEWLLTDTHCHGLLSSRGLAVGNAFDVSGNHVATFAQETLVRHRS